MLSFEMYAFYAGNSKPNNPHYFAWKEKKKKYCSYYVLAKIKSFELKDK